MRAFLLGAIIVLGLLVAVVSGYYVLLDWAALREAYALFEQISAHPSSLNAMLIAEARQNAHRLNCFAEGVGVLLGAILAATGVQGLCLLPSRPTKDV